jgi:hypothetical protein
MAGVQNFVRGIQPPASGQAPSPDRLARAAMARAPITKKGRAISSKGSEPLLSSTAPASDYESNYRAELNSFPKQQHTHYSEVYEPQGGGVPDRRRQFLKSSQSGSFGGTHNQVPDNKTRGTFDDDTLTELESTIVDRHHPEQQQQGGYDDATEEYGISEEDLTSPRADETGHPPNGYEAITSRLPPQQDYKHQSHQPRSQLQASKDDHVYNSDQNPGLGGISGRFQHGEANPGHDKIVFSLPRESKKRDRSGLRNTKAALLSEGQHSTAEDDEMDRPESRPPTRGSEFEHSGISDTSTVPDGQRDHVDRNPPAPVLVELTADYDDSELAKMSYEDLAKETWETEQQSRQLATSSGQGNATEPLKDRFELYLREGEDSQFEYFMQLPIEEWEQTGDLFLERFAGLMKKMRVARQQKRTLVSTYEKTIEERERLVRGKSGNLDNKLQDMRKGGEGVLKGRVS